MTNDGNPKRKRLIRVFASMVVESPEGKGRAYRLTKKPVFMGRRADCDVMVDDPSVSRKHAEIRYDKGRFVVTDLGTPNGTYVNEERVEERQLRRGDVVRVGKMELKLVFVAAAGGAAATASPEAGASQRDEDATAFVDMEKLLASGGGEEDATGFLNMDKILRGEVDESDEHTAFLDMGEVVSKRGKGGASSRRKVFLLGAAAVVLVIGVVVAVAVLTGGGDGASEAEMVELRIGFEVRKAFARPIALEQVVNPSVASIRSDGNVLVMLGVAPGQTEVVVKDSAGGRKKLILKVAPDASLVRGIPLPSEYRNLTQQEKLATAQRLIRNGDTLAEQRQTVLENYYGAFKAYVEAFLILDTLEIKPSMYDEAQGRYKNLEGEIQQIERKYLFEFVKAVKLQRKDLVLNSLNMLMKLFPNREGAKHVQYRSLYDQFSAMEMR